MSELNTLVATLREHHDNPSEQALRQDAADAIERLTAERDDAQRKLCDIELASIGSKFVRGMGE